MLTGWRKTLSKFILIPHRVIVAIMGFLAITIAYTMRISLSLAITEMVVRPNSHLNSTEDTYGICLPDENSGGGGGAGATDDENLYDWSQELQGIILSSFYFGYVITHVPGGMLSVKYGGKFVLITGMFIAAVFSLLTPVLIGWGGAPALIVARVLVGLGEGVAYPSCGALLAAWSPVHERSRLASLVFAGGQIGTIIGSTISGELLYNIGWESVFYFFGGMCIVWCLLFYLLCASNPESHPFISDKERLYLEKELTTVISFKNLPPTPWKSILTCVPLGALIIAQIGHNFGLFIMVSDLPKYMSDVLRFSIQENGLYSALPYVMMWFVAMATGILSDFIIKRKMISITNARKLFTSVGAIGPGIFLVAASYGECNRILVVAMFTIGMGFMGTFYSGIKVNNLDLSPNYAGVLISLTNGIGGITGIVGPYIVGVITPNSALEEWRLVFWIAFAVFVVTTIIYITWASGETQPWNDPDALTKLQLNNSDDIDKNKNDDDANSIHNNINNNNTTTTGNIKV